MNFILTVYKDILYMAKIYRIFYIDLKTAILKSSEFLIQYILITDYNFFYSVWNKNPFEEISK